MANNDRLIELVGLMLEEQRLMHGEQKETNRRLGELTDRFDGLNERVDGLNNRVDGLTARVERLDEQQQTTNVILRQHSRDLEKIVDLLSTQVPHWGDEVQIRSKQKTIKGILQRTS